MEQKVRSNLKAKDIKERELRKEKEERGEITELKEINDTAVKNWRGKKLVIATRELERTGEPWSWKYVGNDKIAMKKKLTEKEKAFVDEYLESHNATAAYRAFKGTLWHPEEWTATDKANWSNLKRKQKIVDYLQEKIFTDAAECLDIQMDLIRNEKTPAAVRNNAIIDRLNRIWVGKQKEEDTWITGIWEVTITIKHKKPDIIEVKNDEIIEVKEEKDLDTNEIIDGEIIQSELWDDRETSWSMGSTN